MTSCESVFSSANLYRAYEDCRRTKRTTLEALQFEMQAEENLAQLQAELLSRAYHPSTSDCFVTRSPKLREIFAADFRDRILHHLLVRYLEPIWEPVFVFDSYASRPHKGIHVAVKRLQGFTRKVTRNNTQRAWYLQLDIKNFFMRINKHILYALIRARCTNEEILWLAATLLFHDPTQDYHLKSPRALLQQLPQQKSLFGTPADCGLPIGNLTSQFFANLYLNSLDQFVKHTLKCRFYMRYVDDFVLLHASRSQLERWQQQIEAYLRSTLELTLNPNRSKLRPVQNGIDFVGYVVRPAYILCRKRVVNNLKARLREFEAQLIQRDRGVTSIRYDQEILEALFACLNSYLAHFRHANAYRLTQQLLVRHAWLGYYFRYYPGRRGQPGRLRRTYLAPKHVRNLRAQYRHFRNRSHGGLIFFQVGCFYEFYDAQADKAGRVLGLTMIAPKHGFMRRCGIGVHALDTYIARAVKHGIPVVVITQTGYELAHVHERSIKTLYLPRTEE